MSRPTVIGVSVDGVTKAGTGKEDARERLVFGQERPYPAGWTLAMAQRYAMSKQVAESEPAVVPPQEADPLAGMEVAQLRALVQQLLPKTPPVSVPESPPYGAEFEPPTPHHSVTAAALQQEGVPGRKDDTGKIDMSLLMDMPHALEAVAEVLQWAITKKLPQPYIRGSWQGVRPFQQRYTAAQLRHEIAAAKARMRGEKPHFARDAETGLLELAHIATDAMFRLENAVRQLSGLAEIEP